MVVTPVISACRLEESLLIVSLKSMFGYAHCTLLDGNEGMSATNLPTNVPRRGNVIRQWAPFHVKT